MKKFIGLFTAFMLVGTLSFAQETIPTSQATKAKCCKQSTKCAKAKCTSIKDCIKSCCQKSKTTNANLKTAEAKSTPSARLVSHIATNTTDLKATSCDPAECAKACGMSIAECKKICESKMGAVKKQVSNKLVSQNSPPKKCCGVTCCKI